MDNLVDGDDLGQEVTPQRPTVLQGRCVGSGICEHQCHVEGAAIQVRRELCVNPENGVIERFLRSGPRRRHRVRKVQPS